MDKEILKMRRRIEHWAEHNDEHSARFLQAAEEAENMGLIVVAEALRQAADKGSEVSDLLRTAIQEIE